MTGGIISTLLEVNLDHLSGESQYNLLNSLGNNSFDSPFPNSFNSPYLTNEQMFDHISDNSFSMVSINIRSLPGKITELANFLDNKGGKKIDIVSMQEIWNVPTGVQLNIEGYHPLLYKIRDMSGQKSNVGGGVGLFINNDFEYELLDDISIFDKHVFESIFVKIYINSKEYIILGSIYRPNTGPLASIPIASDYIDSICSKIKESNHLKNASDIFLTGDLNVNLLDYKLNNQTSKFLDNLLANAQLPLITHPTRISKRAATLLDVITTNNVNRDFFSGIITTALADHFPTFLTFKIKSQTHKKPNVQFRDFSGENITNFKARLQAMDWENLFKIKFSQTAFTTINNKINKVFNEVFPLKTKCINKAISPIKPWMTISLLISRKTKKNCS